ncbi:hypothetical protein ACT4UM_08145 [Bacillus sp. SS-TM]
MYPNLRAEMARKRIMITQISSHLKLRHATVSDKIKTKFTIYFVAHCCVQRWREKEL